VSASTWWRRLAQHGARLLARLGKGDAFVGAALLLLFVYYIANRGVFQGKASGDGWFGFNYLRAIVFHGTLDMQKPLPEFMPFFGVTGPGHHMPNRCPFGPVIVWMPFYLVGIGLELLGAALHLTKPVTGASPFAAWVTGLGTLAAVLVGCRATFALLSRHLSRDAARIGAIMAVWATPIAWYAAVQPFYQHGLAFGGTALLVERWDAGRGKASLGRFILLGFIGGLTMTMREQEAMFLLLPGFEALYFLIRRPQRLRWLACGVVLTVTALVSFLPQMLVWRYYTGSLFSPPQIEPLRLRDPFFIVALFSTRGGLFPWSPICYAATLGLFFCRRVKTLTLGLIGVFALELYLVASAWVVTGAYAFGSRRLSDSAVLIALGVALLWDRLATRRGRGLLVAFATVCATFNVLAMELLRAHRIASSGAYARPASHFLDEEMHAPKVFARLFDTIGYPFVQPVGWIFALWHHVPVSTFEGVVGNFFLDRDGQWFQVQTHELGLAAGARSYAPEGLDFTQKPARVKGPVRLILPMFAKEEIVVLLHGTLSDPSCAGCVATWNGASVPLQVAPMGLRLTVPQKDVRAGVNELRLTLPLGTQLQKIEFQSFTQWWLK
jgi:hypothetical protein